MNEPRNNNESAEDLVVRLLFSERINVLAYIRGIVTDSQLAEDVFQNTAIIAIRKSEALTSPIGFLPWVRSIARFEALNSLRKLKSKPKVFESEVLDQLDVVWKNSQPSKPMDYLEGLEHCRQKLSPRARKILELRYVSGLTGQSLADALNSKLNTAYVALSRVHGQLRTCIQQFLTREHKHG